MSFQFFIPWRLFSEGRLEFVGTVVKETTTVFANLFDSSASRDLSSVFYYGPSSIHSYKTSKGPVKDSELSLSCILPLQ